MNFIIATVKFVGGVVAASAEATQASAIAAMSMAEILLRLISVNLAKDLNQYKTALLLERSARSAKVIEEAAQLANETTRQRRANELDELKALLESAELGTQIIKARSRLDRAIRNIKASGGNVGFRASELKSKLSDGPPAIPDQVHLLASSVDRLELSVRTQKLLKQHGFQTIGDIYANYFKLPGIGFPQTSRHELARTLTVLGLYLPSI